MKYFQLKFSNHSFLYLIIIFCLMIVFYPFLPFVGTFLLIILLFTAFFFRDPDKIIPTGDNLIVSPADGVITYIGQNEAPSETDIENIEYNKISIFLSVFDIHVNRVPTTGKVLLCKYIPGKFMNATFDKSSDENERNIIKMKDKNNNIIVFVQIAGLIARRIVSDLKIDQNVSIGDRYGIIKFGSRVDIYIPKKIKLQVAVGQKVIGGQSVLADIKNNSSIGDTSIK